MPSTRAKHHLLVTSTVTGHDVWPLWVDGTNASTLYVDALKASVATDERVWKNWIRLDSYTTAATAQQTYYINETATAADTQTTWHNWITVQNMRYQGYERQHREPTPEERLARATAQLETEARRRAAAEANAAAVTRARTLLDSVLSDEQKADLDRHGRFFVRGSRGRRYCINARGQSGNVQWVDEQGRALGTFCAHPGESVPAPDAWLAQMLALEHDEDAFLRTANVHGGRRPELVR